MTSREWVAELIEHMPEQLAREVQHYAEFLLARSQDGEWTTYSLAHLGARYAREEIEYTTDDLKP